MYCRIPTGLPVTLLESHMVAHIFCAMVYIHHLIQEALRNENRSSFAMTK